MEFSEKLITLRRREGLSQEQLADRLGVTRQSVSKWESGAVMPELVKLISLSEIFGVSVDYLVKDYLEEEEIARTAADTGRLESKIDDLAKTYHRALGPYFSYTSKMRILGLPLVSVRFGRARNPTRDTLAVGIIAIGNFAVGIVSLGLISLGVLSLGLIAFGALALGAVSIGWLAFGVSAVGIYAVGTAACGLRIAVGVSAHGAVSVGKSGGGQHILMFGGSRLHQEEIEAFLLEYCPNLWRPLLRLLGHIGWLIQ